MSLVRRKVVDFETLEQALKMKQKGGSHAHKSLAQILVGEFGVDHNKIYSELADLYGFKKINLAEEVIDENRLDFIRKLWEKLPENIRNIMEHEKLLIFKQTTDNPPKYVFVAVDPTSRVIPSIARAVGAPRYETYYISPSDYDNLLTKIFPPENEYLKMLEEAGIELQEEEDSEDDALDEDDLESEINKSVLVNLVEGMLIEAVRQGASDIHIIPSDARTSEIMFRIDGKLRPWPLPKKVRPEALAAVVKDRSKNIDRFEREMAQDGFIQREIDGHWIRFRVSVIPIVSKDYQHKLESIVLRVLDDRKVITDLDKLGFQGKAKESFIKAISKPQGMVILTGPTGSGKSTTLIAALHYIMRPEINVLTVEDPVEYIIPGARQIKIGPKNNFEQAMRTILRHDPDVVMVGEMRDKETAEIAIKMANTGHLTFSTLHTNDAPSAVSRLYKMGVEPFLIAYAINIIIAQRLIRRLCDKCKKPMEDLDPAIPLTLGFTEKEIQETVFYEPVGCSSCHGGYKGRIAIHEALYFSKAIRSLIFTAGSDINEEAIRNQAIKEGMLTLRAAARERVKQGITSLEEVAHATQED
ncbi:MAG: type II/IV secretion system protein [Calditrichaeota bacterium]|nr:MAG: type II/IV secretion system protein [Calditrichota bacterium]